MGVTLRDAALGGLGPWRGNWGFGSLRHKGRLLHVVLAL